MNYLNKKNKILISGNNGNWFIARNNQIQAYYAFISQDKKSILKFITSSGTYYWVRSQSNGQSNRWC